MAAFLSQRHCEPAARIRTGDIPCAAARAASEPAAIVEAHVILGTDASSWRRCHRRLWCCCNRVIAASRSGHGCGCKARLAGSGTSPHPAHQHPQPSHGIKLPRPDQIFFLFFGENGGIFEPAARIRTGTYPVLQHALQVNPLLSSKHMSFLAQMLAAGVVVTGVVMRVGGVAVVVGGIVETEDIVWPPRVVKTRPLTSNGSVGANALGRLTLSTTLPGSTVRITMSGEILRLVASCDLIWVRTAGV